MTGWSCKELSASRKLYACRGCRATRSSASTETRSSSSHLDALGCGWVTCCLWAIGLWSSDEQISAHCCWAEIRTSDCDQASRERLAETSQVEIQVQLWSYD